MDLPATQICYDFEDEPTQKIVQNVVKENEQVGVLIVNNNSYPIYKGISKIGRHPECDIFLNDQSVSKYHAEIEANRHTSSTWICDLESSNKTILNNVTLRSSRFYELQDNSVLEFGRIKAIYKNHCAKNDFVVPETPVQSKQKNPTVVIPGTPDSSLSNSSVFGEDISMIAGTQSSFRKSSSSHAIIERLHQKISQSNEKNNSRVQLLDSSKEHKQAETSNKDNKTDGNKVSEDGNESNIRFSDQNDKNQALTSLAGTNRFSVETMQNNATVDQNDPSTSCESDDIFEAVTQRVNVDVDFRSKRESHSSSDETNIDEDVIINDMAPTQKMFTTLESSTPIKKTNLDDQIEKSKNICKQENINNIEDIDMLDTQIVSLPDSIHTIKEVIAIEKQTVINNIDTLDTQIMNLPQSDLDVNNEKQREKRDDIDLLDTQSVSITERADQNMSPSLIKEVQPNLIDDGSIEDVHYETAATQLIDDVEAVPEKQDSKTKHSGDSESRKVNADDSLEQKLNDMFEEVNDDNIADTSMISTQTLQNVLECSQRNTRVANTPSHLVNDPLSTQVQNVKSVDSNSQKSETDSQNTEKYFSSFISKRKHNVIADTQESVDLNVALRTRHKKKKESNTKTLEKDKDDAASTKTSPKRSTRGKQKTNDSEKTVDHVEKDLLNSFEVSVHSSKEDTKCTETSKSLDEEDDDILSRLPEVNISGTFSNPTTALSTSLVQKNRRSTRRSNNKETNKKADTSDVYESTCSTTSMSDSMDNIDYEKLKKMAEALISCKQNEIKSTKRRTTNTKKKSGSDVSKQTNTTPSNKSAPNTRGRKSKGNTSLESKSILSYVTRRNLKENTESKNENASNAIPPNSNKRQTRSRQMNTKAIKTDTSNIKDNTSVNRSSSPVGEESQEVEMIMNKSLANVSENTRKRKKLNASSDNDSSQNSNISQINLINSMHYKIPTVRVKRTKLDKSTASQSSIESTSTESSLIDDTDSSMTTKTRSSRSKRMNVKEQKNENNTNIVTKMNTRNTLNSTSVKLESSKETVSDRPASTIPRNVSRLSTSLNSSFSVKEKILFTGITDDEYIKVLKTLGGIKVEDPSKCTVLVTDKIRRTTKFLSALARAVPIVSINWLQESKRAGQFLEWENYMLKDPAMEAKYGFRLRKSLDKAREHKLLEGYTVLLTPNIQSPPTAELRVMIQSCGGKAFIRPPPKLSEKTIILSQQDDIENARKLLLKVPKNVTIQSTEFLLTGILKQELDFVRHKLI